MKIRELLNEDSAPESMIKLSAILSQLSGRVADTGADKKMNLDSLVGLLNDAGVYISAQRFKEMVDNEEEPVSNYIAGYDDQGVSFLGQNASSDSDAIKPDNTTGTLEKMAKRAQNKRD